jgi:hypothetical protein
MNAHQRRVAERARNLDGFKAHRDRLREQAPTFWPALPPSIGRIRGNVVIDAPQGIYAGTHAIGPFGKPFKPEIIEPLDLSPLESKSDELQPGSFADFRDYVYVEGGSVRHRKTKTIATALARRPLGMILVHRRDNRKVEWPVSECENWNL